MHKAVRVKPKTQWRPRKLEMPGIWNICRGKLLAMSGASPREKDIWAANGKAVGVGLAKPVRAHITFPVCFICQTQSYRI
jgi:hypothetical protein